MNFTIDYANKFIYFLCLLPSWICFLLLISGLRFFEWFGLMILGQVVLTALYRYIVLNVFESQMWKGYWMLFSVQLASLVLCCYFLYS